jgi:FixJ family two-component response regulator
MMSRDAKTVDAVVYIVDDDALVRTATTRAFKTLGFHVLTFADAQAFLDHERADLPGCLILDVNMPDLTGIELQEQLVSHQIDLPIVFISAHGDIPMSVKAIKAGAADFLPKPVDQNQLIETVQNAIDQHVIEREDTAEITELRRRVDSLSKRESEVLLWVVQGLLNKQIARRLGITEYTVKVHRRHVMDKIEAESLAELVRMCERSGVATSPQDS